MTTIQLPAPIEMTMPLSQVLGRRRSRREFAADPLDPAILSTLLWACAGRNSEDGRRTAPSAYNSLEVECFVFDARGVWRYDADAHALELVAEGDKRAMSTTTQEYVHTAPVSIVFATNLTKAGRLTGSRMGDICRSVDVGVMLQNALLAASAMGLAAVARAGIDPEQVLAAIGATGEQYEPQMAVTVGFPA